MLAISLHPRLVDTQAVCFKLQSIYTCFMKLMDGSEVTKLYFDHAEVDGCEAAQCFIDGQTDDTNAILLRDVKRCFADRLGSANQIEVLSTRNGKVLTVEREADGSKFVKRAYSPDGTKEVLGGRRYYDFEESWEAMEHILDGAGMPKVRSSLVSSNETGALVISDYVDGTKLVRDVSVEAKKEFARRLVHCYFGDSTKGRLKWLMLSEDGFLVTTDETGKDEVILVDVDPYVQIPTSRPDNAWFVMNRMGRLFRDEWCSREDREEVLAALVDEIGKTLDQDELLMDKNLMSFRILSNMSQDIASRVP